MEGVSNCHGFRQSRDALWRRQHLSFTFKGEMVAIHWVEKSGRALEARKKQTHMQRHTGVKGHDKVEETVQDRQEMSQQT